jgi:hypothetical protein
MHLTALLACSLYLLALNLATESIYEHHRLIRGAVVITLAGQDRLAEYFRWSCLSIEASQEMFDMLVFHEANEKLKNLRCGKNVIFYDVGVDGLSKRFLDAISGDSGSGDSTNSAHVELGSLLARMIRLIPRILVEIKPLTGIMFHNELKPYSHWTYSDPDIIWGNLSLWLDFYDIASYEVITGGKYMDSGRLFLRGQFTLHANIPEVNMLWEALDYFDKIDVAQRIASAAALIDRHKEQMDNPHTSNKITDMVFMKYFHSAEGWYSKAVFEHASRPRVLIVSLGFDDFNKMPIILYNNTLMRCESKELEWCVEQVQERQYQIDMKNALQIAHSNPNPSNVVVTDAVNDKSVCRMQWLPVATRYCLVGRAYSSNPARDHDGVKPSKLRLKQTMEARWEPIGSGSASSSGQMKWTVATRHLSRDTRELLGEVAAFFHFRHWDDYLATEGKITKLPDGIPDGALQAASALAGAGIGPPRLPACTFLWLTRDSKLAFQDCQSGIHEQNSGVE